MPTTVIHIGEHWRNPHPDDVYIGRGCKEFPKGTIWGNPFRIGKMEAAAK
jgi:hypothetical protein